MHTEFFVRLIDTDAKTLESPHRIETIFASAIARNCTGPVRQGCQDDGAMGDRLIARNGNRSRNGLPGVMVNDAIGVLR